MGPGTVGVVIGPHDAELQTMGDITDPPDGGAAPDLVGVPRGLVVSFAPDVAGRPDVRVGHDHSPVIDRVLGLFAQAPIFARDGELVEVVGAGVARIAVARVAELASHHARFRRYDAKGGEWVRCSVPHWLAKELSARPSMAPVRVLDGVSTVPVLRADGSVHDEPGYDAASRIWHEPGDDVAPRTPTTPTKTDAVAALGRVARLYHQFPFATEAGRAAHLALVISATTRHLISGAVPIGIYAANRRQVGKSLLAQSVAIIATGRTAGMSRMVDDDAKMADELFARASAAAPVVLFDNVRSGTVVSSPVLDGAITSGRIEQRKRYSDAPASPAFRPIVMITGNHIRIGGDLEPRSLLIRLASAREHPEARDDLEIDDFLQAVAERRAEIVADLITARRAYILAGRPACGLRPWHTVSGWHWVRELLVWAGWPDPATVRQESLELDEDTELRRRLLPWIEREFPRGEGATRLLAHLRSHTPNDDHIHLRSCVESRMRGDNVELDPRTLGLLLAQHKDVPSGGRVLRQRVKPHNMGTLWRVEECVGDEREPGDDDPEAVGR